MVKIENLGTKSPQLKVDNIHSIRIKKLLNFSKYEYEASKTKDVKTQSIIVFKIIKNVISILNIAIPNISNKSKTTKSEQTSDIIIVIALFPLTIKCE